MLLFFFFDIAGITFSLSLSLSLYTFCLSLVIKRTFTPEPIVSYRSAHKLSSYFVRAKLYPIERKVGSYKCKGKRCEVCKNVLETDTFTCSNDQTTYKINHKFDCNEKCLVYLITCNKAVYWTNSRHV